jgi:anti-sigma B factor antagonist
MSVIEHYTDRGVEVLVVLPAEVSRAEVVERLGHQIRRAVDESGRAAFVLDLSRVTFMTSAALGLLMNMQAHLGKRGARFAVAGISGEVARVVEQTRLGQVMPVHQTVADAVEALGA